MIEDELLSLHTHVPSVFFTYQRSDQEYIRVSLPGCQSEFTRHESVLPHDVIRPSHFHAVHVNPTFPDFSRTDLQSVSSEILIFVSSSEYY